MAAIRVDFAMWTLVHYFLIDGSNKGGLRYVDVGSVPFDRWQQ